MKRTLFAVLVLALAACGSDEAQPWMEDLLVERADLRLPREQDTGVPQPLPLTTDAAAPGHMGGDGGISVADVDCVGIPDAKPQEQTGPQGPPAPACKPICGGKQCGPDGCGATCGTCAYDALCFAGACALGPPPAPGDLAVNEFMSDPAAVPDKDGEWFEVLCNSDGVVDLWGLTVRSGSKESFIVDRSLPAQPGQILSFARTEGTASNGGVTPDFVYSGLQLSNEADSLRLEFSGELLDEVVYSPPDLKVKPGFSLGLDPWLADSELNDYPSAWCLAKSKMAGGDRGTPGGVNDPCP
jgi:hypothetical protein